MKNNWHYNETLLKLTDRSVYVNVCVCSLSWCFVTPQHRPVFLKGHRNNPQLDVSCNTDFPEISMRPTYPVPLILRLSSKSVFHLPSVTSSARKENKWGKAKRNRGPKQNWGQKFSLTKTEDWKTLGEMAPWSQDTLFPDSQAWVIHCRQRWLKIGQPHHTRV